MAVGGFWIVAFLRLSLQVPSCARLRARHRGCLNMAKARDRQRGAANVVLPPPGHPRSHERDAVAIGRVLIIGGTLLAFVVAALSPLARSSMLRALVRPRARGTARRIRGAAWRTTTPADAARRSPCVPRRKSRRCWSVIAGLIERAASLRCRSSRRCASSRSERREGRRNEPRYADRSV